MLIHEPGRASAWYYAKGCPCTECREAARIKRKASRDRARAKNSPSYQRELESARARKRIYRGVCERCGGETRYAGHEQKVSKVCQACANTPHTHCKRGHELSGENRLRNGSGWVCRTCRNAYMREYQARRRREAGVPERGPYLERRLTP